MQEPPSYTHSVKGYIRKGKLHQTLKEYQKCLQVYEKALELEPDNAEVAAALREVVALINARSHSDPESAARTVAQDPALRAILEDPLMQQVLGELQRDPASAEKLLANPQVRANMEKLIAAGIVKIN